MRFGVSRVLDAIEARLTLDPALARGVLDLAEVVRLIDLDGDAGKPASLLRLGHVLDAAGRYLAEDGVAVYVVLARSVLSDLDLTANERMVVRRWADDGLVEVLPEVGDRVLQVAELLGVPVLSRRRFPEYADRYPWLPGGLLAPAAAGLATVTDGASARPFTSTSPVLARLWRCPEPGCAGFGAPSGGQPPPRLPAAVPTCPRHGARLADAGPRPAVQVLAVRVDGAVRGRFVVREAAPVAVGRAPGGDPPEIGAPRPGTPSGGPYAGAAPAGSQGAGPYVGAPRGGPYAGAAETVVALGPLLGEEARRWVSRRHLRLELRGGALTVTDSSTNGTTVRTPAGPVPLTAGRSSGIGPDDVIELYQGVELGRPSRFYGGAAEPASVMAEAPTVMIRLPRA